MDPYKMEQEALLAQMDLLQVKVEPQVLVLKVVMVDILRGEELVDLLTQ